MDTDECLKRLSHMDFERSNTRDRLALHFAIDFIEKLRWRKLSEEKPPEEGYYLTACNNGFLDKRWWDGKTFRSLYITHWKPIEMPEEEE